MKKAGTDFHVGDSLEKYTIRSLWMVNADLTQRIRLEEKRRTDRMRRRIRSTIQVGDVVELDRSTSIYRPDGRKEYVKRLRVVRRTRAQGAIALGRYKDVRSDHVYIWDGWVERVFRRGREVLNVSKLCRELGITR